MTLIYFFLSHKNLKILFFLTVNKELKNNKNYLMEDIDVCRSSNTHNNMICLSCHGPNDVTLGYVSIDSSLIIGQLER